MFLRAAIRRATTTTAAAPLARSFASQLQFYDALMLTPEQAELRLAVEKFAD